MARVPGMRIRRIRESRAMRGTLLVFVAAALVAGVIGCSGSDTKHKVDSSGACGDAMGERGADWLRGRVDAYGGVIFRDGEEVERAQALFRKQVESWDPERGAVVNFGRTDICQVTGRSAEPGDSLQVRFGPSTYSFRFPFGEPSRYLDRQSVAESNSSVRLVWGRLGERGNVAYRTYVKCKVEGAAPEQELQVPLQGTMTDTLPTADSPRSHFRHLLHATRVVVDGLGCTNKPVVPLEVPAAVP
ncbi:hypothetical protein DSC45_07280 [Streptomyces sp. YIM 130001]|nr:hypothetical protein DSC45_07280 [Streptomyces sp. YIM 130001]